MHLRSLEERLNDQKLSAVEDIQRKAFSTLIKTANIPNNSKALSVSAGNGIWDGLAFKNNKKITDITATDIVENPVQKESRGYLRTYGKWTYKKVEAEKPLPFTNNTFDMVFHQDVVEHVENPYLFLSEQHRVLKKNGALIFGTPNLFRPTNVLRLIVGKLKFPVKIWYDEELGDYIHIQEFYEQQAKVVLKEVGFEKVEVKHCFFGIYPLNITISKYPKSNLGKTLCHYLLFRCYK